MKKVKPKIPPVPIVRFVVALSNILRKISLELLPPQALMFDYTVENILIQRSLWIAAELGIADTLKKEGPKSIAELAKENRRNEDTLYRVMRLLSSFGIFKETKGKVFETTALSRCLESDHEQSMLDMILWCGSKTNFNIWVDLMNSVKTGRSYFQNNFKQDYFTFIGDKPDEQIGFNNLLIEFSTLSTDPVTAAYKFKAFDTIVDIGAGMGGQLISMLKANPKLKGVVYELPLTVEMLKNDKIFENAGIADRVELIAGDFFKSVPEGYDAYFMKHIIHDWKDEQAIQLLTNCRKAMRKNSKLLVAEIVIPEPNVRHIAYSMLLLMLVFNEGRERTLEEYIHLFKEAGLKLNRRYYTACPFSILEAVPA